MPGIKWTKEELEYVKNNLDKTAREIGEALGRRPKAIHAAIAKMKIESGQLNSSIVTDEHDEFILNNPNLTRAQLRQNLKVSDYFLKCRFLALGIKKRANGDHANSGNDYETWEDCFIGLTIDIPAAEVGSYLGRSTDSIRLRKARLGYRRYNSPRPIKPGDAFGMLTVEEFDRKGKDGIKIWKCKCECGQITYVDTGKLNFGHTTSCGCYRLKKIRTGFGHISGTFYSSIRYNAGYRGLEFNLTIEYLNNLLEKQNFKCKLSNLDIKIDTRSIDGVVQETTASLDRIDSNLGYIDGNVQWLHKTVQLMKMNLSQEEFIKMCKIIAQEN